MSKIGRNDLCPCGSGQKYKKCCLAKQVAPITDATWLKMRKTEGELMPALLDHAKTFYGKESILEAWDEFSLWKNSPLDPDAHPEVETAFLPWFVFNWIPDNTDIPEAEHLPEIPVAMHYLERKGARLDDFQRRFIQEICLQPYSFFMVTDVIRGESLTIRDLFLGREVTVHERQASATLLKASIIFTRIITMDETSIMVGCAPTAIPPTYHNAFIDSREVMAETFPTLDQAALLDYDLELRTIYYQIRESLSHPNLPNLENTDGETLQITKLHYTLTCTPRQALQALITLSLTEELEDILQEGTYDETGELVSIEFPWLKSGNPLHTNWNNTMLGHLTIHNNLLTIDVNSQERADVIKREIETRLGNQAAFRNAVIQSSEKMMEEIANRPPVVNPEAKRNVDLQTPEVQAKLQEMSEQHWRGWLDTAIPALKDQTPREAAKTATGRERLEALLWQFEEQSGSLQAFAPDVKTLRQELGLD